MNNALRAFAALAILFAGGAASAGNKKEGQTCQQAKDCASKTCQVAKPGEKKKVCVAAPTTTTTKTTTTTAPSTGTPSTTPAPKKSYAAAATSTPSPSPSPSSSTATTKTTTTTTTTTTTKKGKKGATSTTASTSQPKACTPPLATRQKDVTDKCKTESRSCNKGGLTCEEIKAREQANEACRAARVYVQGCYTSIDEGHQTAIDDAARAVAACQQKFINKKCK